MEEINENQAKAIKISVSFVGDASVGKTSIIHRIVKDKFEDHIQPTVGTNDFPFYNESSDPPTLIVMHDTAGQDSYRKLIPSIVRNSNICIIVYSVENTDSLESVDPWVEFIHDNSNQDTIIYLVENKCDLRENSIVIQEEEGRQKAESINAKFISVSAKTGKNINSIIEQISEDYLTKIYTNKINTVEPIIITEISDDNKSDGKKCC